MAGGAVTRDAIMIEDRREERRGVMAEVAVLRGRDMVHRRTLTDGVNPIVTTFAIVRHAGVIKHPSGKAAGVMAYPAILGGGDVRRGFTCGVGTVVARSTITGDALVREDRGTKRRGGMTQVAILRSR